LAGWLVSRYHAGSRFRGFEATVTRYFEDEVSIITLANLAEADLACLTRRHS
jgi:hypothetical protein